MTKQDLENLQPGDVVRHWATGRAYTVLASFGERATAVAVADVTNPDEWDVIVKAHPQRVEP